MSKRKLMEGLFLIEIALRRCAKQIETYRMAHDRDSDELDSLFEDVLEQADHVRMIAQPIVVTYRK